MLQPVWTRMLQFPHVFEVAQARGVLHEYDLHGVRRLERQRGELAAPTTLRFRGWTFPVRDLGALLDGGRVEPSICELLSQLLRLLLPRDVVLHSAHVLRAQKLDAALAARTQPLQGGVLERLRIVPFRAPSSKRWAAYVLEWPDVAAAAGPLPAGVVPATDAAAAARTRLPQPTLLELLPSGTASTGLTTTCSAWLAPGRRAGRCGGPTPATTCFSSAPCWAAPRCVRGSAAGPAGVCSRRRRRRAPGWPP